jgi:hypothetical protein
MTTPSTKFILLGGPAALSTAFDTLTVIAAPAPQPAAALPPITVEMSALAGTTVQINAKQPLNINTGDVAVDNYSLVSATPEGIVTFIAGRSGGSAVFNPAFIAVAQGTTEVVLHNSADPASQNIAFTIEVVAAP